MRDDERAIAQYWNGDYQALTGSEDPRILSCSPPTPSIARCARLAGRGRAVVGRLDRSPSATPTSSAPTPANEEAAFNYEFVLRLRAAVLKSKQPLPAGDAALVRPDRARRGRRPPRDSDAKKFKMIVPMLPDERQEAEEAGRSGQKVRKG